MLNVLVCCRCIEWLKPLKACGRHDLLNAPIVSVYRNFRICSVHFETKMYSNPEKTRLLPQAVPTLFSMYYLISKCKITHIIFQFIVKLYLNVRNLDHNCEPTLIISISDQKPDESAYNYEEPQTTSTPTLSENVHC